MANYTILTNDEKSVIVDSAVRALEYQMYSLELDLIAENAKETPDAARVTFLTSAVAEKVSQIAAVKA